MKSTINCFRRVVSSVWFKVAIAVLVIGLLFYFNRIDLSVLYSLSETWPWLLTAFLLTLPTYLIVTYRFKVILSSQGLDIPFRYALRFTMIGFFFDLAMPSSNGGDLIKAGYAATYVGPGYRTRAVMAVAFDRLIGLLGLFSLTAVVCIVGWNFLAGLPSRRLILGLSLLACIGPLIILRIAGARRIYNNSRLNNWLLTKTWGPRFKQFIGSFNALRENPKKLFATLGLSMLNHLVWCTSIQFITIAVGNNIPPVEGYIVYPLAIFCGVFGVASGFGIGTAAFDFLFSHLLLVRNGALIGLLFQISGALSRLLGLPFYLANERISRNLNTIKP